jgi:hypothetical protein
MLIERYHPCNHDGWHSVSFQIVISGNDNLFQQNIADQHYPFNHGVLKVTRTQTRRNNSGTEMVLGKTEVGYYVDQHFENKGSFMLLEKEQVRQSSCVQVWHRAYLTFGSGL